MSVSPAGQAPSLFCVVGCLDVAVSNPHRTPLPRCSYHYYPVPAEPQQHDRHRAESRTVRSTLRGEVGRGDERRRARCSDQRHCSCRRCDEHQHGVGEAAAVRQAPARGLTRRRGASVRCTASCLSGGCSRSPALHPAPRRARCRRSVPRPPRRPSVTRAPIDGPIESATLSTPRACRAWRGASLAPQDLPRARRSASRARLSWSSCSARPWCASRDLRSSPGSSLNFVPLSMIGFLSLPHLIVSHWGAWASHLSSARHASVARVSIASPMKTLNRLAPSWRTALGRCHRPCGYHRCPIDSWGRAQRRHPCRAHHAAYRYPGRARRSRGRSARRGSRSELGHRRRPHSLALGRPERPSCDHRGAARSRSRHKREEQGRPHPPALCEKEVPKRRRQGAAGGGRYRVRRTPRAVVRRRRAPRGAFRSRRTWTRGPGCTPESDRSWRLTLICHPEPDHD